MSAFTFRFLANACGIFTGSSGTRLLCDPWLIDGVFEGSWCHYPPVTTRPEELLDVDGIYLSHLHPDHFDERHFPFRRDIPIFTLDHGYNFLLRKLRSLGFSNLTGIADRQKLQFNEFTLQCFAPFAKDAFHDAAIGNIIDSALIVECDGLRAFNANDNTPTLDAVRELREDGTCHLAMLNYNAAGPYPSCFDNLSDTEKRSEHSRILRRNFQNLLELVTALTPQLVLPFAGAYVIGGSERHKNAFLGTTTWDECAEYLKGHLPAMCGTRVVVLRENDILDISTGNADRPYRPVNIAEQDNYIERELASLVYPYQEDISPDLNVLAADVITAAARMHDRWQKMGLRARSHIFVDVAGKAIPIHKAPEDSTGEPTKLVCTMDPRLLRRILDRRAHWNNAEIGCHINFVRTPNIFEPDLHVGLAFFHL